MARAMVCHWGMSDKLGMVQYGENNEYVFLGREMIRSKDYSEKTAQEIDSRSLLSGKTLQYFGGVSNFLNKSGYEVSSWRASSASNGHFRLRTHTSTKVFLHVSIKALRKIKALAAGLLA